MHHRTRLLFAFVFAALFAAQPLHAKKPETGFLDRAVTIQGIEYKYQVYLPVDWTTVYVRLWTQLGRDAGWQPSDYTYTAALALPAGASAYVRTDTALSRAVIRSSSTATVR